MVRASVRGLLQQYWAAADLSAPRPEAAAALWRQFITAGLGDLGADSSGTGASEIIVVMEELGAAACPAPMLGAVLTNLLIKAAGPPSAVASDLLQNLHSGSAVVSVALGALDGDRAAGFVKFNGGTVSGRARFVEGADTATHIVTALENGGIAVVPANAAQVRVNALDGLAIPPLSTIDFSGALADRIEVDDAVMRDVSMLARLCLLGRALGAASRGFDLVVDYTRTREQFGQAIGAFQAIQHKLANSWMNLSATRLALTKAASAYDSSALNWRFLASVAYAHGSSALRSVALETVHTFGAIGFAEEHEAAVHFRRVHADVTRYGGPMRAREDIAAALFDQGVSLRQADPGDSVNALRAEVRNWLIENWHKGPSQRELEVPFHKRGQAFRDAEFSARQEKAGWHVAAWPREFGGQARSALEQLAILEEYEYANAPIDIPGQFVSHALINFGTTAQQDKFLPMIRRGDERFCLGYSEPGAGSDLASLRTSAVLDGDEWVINGQKLWNNADAAEYIWLAARTEQSGKRGNGGVSVFIVPLDVPGIIVRPNLALYGHNFCAVFFDNVRVPYSALVGEVNQGWKIITSALVKERVVAGGFIAKAGARFEALVESFQTARDSSGKLMKDDPIVRDRVGLIASEIEIARQLVLNGISKLDRASPPIAEAAASKVFTSEMMERMAEATIDIAGMSATISDPAEGAIGDGKIEHMLREAMMLVIGGGTNEIQRNVIARYALNLPRAQ